MAVTLFTATGCARCKIVKKFMDDRGIPYEEKDIKAEGKTCFQQFYRQHHRSILRGPDGIAFPVCFSGGRVSQGIGPVLAWIQGGDRLDRFVQRGVSHDWRTESIHISGGEKGAFEELLPVLRFMKKNGLRLEVRTDGRHPELLRELIKERLADRGVMTLLGPEALYARILEREIDTRQVEETMTLVSSMDDYRIETPVVPVTREDGKRSYLTPEEVGEAAAWLSRVTGSKKNPYVIKFADRDETAEPADGAEPRPRAIQSLFIYRTCARRHQVKAEIEKP